MFTNRELGSFSVSAHLKMQMTIKMQKFKVTIPKMKKMIQMRMLNNRIKSKNSKTSKETLNLNREEQNYKLYIKKIMERIIKIISDLLVLLKMC